MAKKTNAELADYYNETEDLSGFDDENAVPVTVRRSVTISVRFSDSEIAELRARAAATPPARSRDYGEWLSGRGDRLLADFDELLEMLGSEPDVLADPGAANLPLADRIGDPANRDVQGKPLLRRSSAVIASARRNGFMLGLEAVVIACS